MGRFGVGQKDRVTMWGMFYSCNGNNDDTNKMIIREDEDVSNACLTTRSTSIAHANTWSLLESSLGRRIWYCRKVVAALLAQQMCLKAVEDLVCFVGNSHCVATYICMYMKGCDLHARSIALSISIWHRRPWSRLGPVTCPLCQRLLGIHSVGLCILQGHKSENDVIDWSQLRRQLGTKNWFQGWQCQIKASGSSSPSA